MIGLATWVRGFGSCFNRHYELNKNYRTLSGITLAGAALNVGLTFLLVPSLLGLGAALATLISQVLVAIVFVVARDRALVSFPMADAGFVLLGVARARRRRMAAVRRVGSRDRRVRRGVHGDHGRRLAAPLPSFLTVTGTSRELAAAFPPSPGQGKATRSAKAA